MVAGLVQLSIPIIGSEGNKPVPEFENIFERVSYFHFPREVTVRFLAVFLEGESQSNGQSCS